MQVQQSGTPEAPHVKLTIPRGDTGAVEGIDYFAGEPSALGTASPGTANGVARGDHVHPMPTADDVGALPVEGTAADASKLGGVDASSYVQKSQIVNNFATTEAGFVADARALASLKAEIGTITATTAIVNATGDTQIPYPEGINKNNVFVVSAKCVSKYGSMVDYAYDDFAYYGEMTFTDSYIKFTPYVAGNTTQITLLLIAK